MKFENDQHAMEVFISAAILHSETSENGDYKEANKNYDLLVKAGNYLNKNKHIDELEKLLTHSETSVRIAVAANLLAHNTYVESAILVLESLEKQNIVHKSFVAKMILVEYRAGNFKL